MMKLGAAIIAGLTLTACESAYAGGNYGAYGKQSYVTKASRNVSLTASNGMTLYTFDKDSTGKTNCYGDCADSWPPFTASAKAKAPSAAFTKVKRKDGTLQWAKDGAPLYFWIGDTKPGDTNGDGIGGVWHIAR